VTRKLDRGEDERWRRCRVGQGDNDADEATESLGLVVGQPPGRRRMELPGMVTSGLRGRWGVVTVSPSRLRGRLGKASGG